jgi:serine/threonine-protein kinase RsbW
MARWELVLLAAEPEVATESARWVESHALRAGLAAKAASELAASALEAVNNSIEHGYRDSGGAIGLSLDADATSVTVAVTDNGTGLPATVPDSIPEPTAERGRGSWIMRQWCDSVRHELEPGVQRVVLVKRRSDAAPQPSSQAQR